MSSRFKLVTVLLKPSILSGFFSIVFAVFVIGHEGWAYANHQTELYNYLTRNFGLSTLPSTANGGPSVISTLLSNGAAYQVLLLVCAIGVGLLVYALMRGLNGIAEESQQAIAELRQHGLPHHIVASSPLLRIALRLASFAAWAVYAVLFVNLLVPFAVLLTQYGCDRFVSSWFVGSLYLFSAVALLSVAGQLHAVFMRISFLRLRIFGGIDTDLYVSSNK
jgi:hypothetical protein